MNDEPTIGDFLAQQEGDDFSLEEEYSWSDFGANGEWIDASISESQQRIGDYLAELLGASGKFEDYDPEHHNWKEIQKLWGLEGFQDMDEEALAFALGYGSLEDRSPSMQKSIKDRLDFAKAIQEGFGSIKTFDEYGGKKKIAGVEKETERDIQSAYSGYIPGEILSRYGSLQGRGGEAKGEMAEAEFLSSVSSADRRKGRGIGSIYDKYEEGLFDDISNWLS